MLNTSRIKNRKIVSSLIILITFFSCSKQSDIVYTEINNEELKSQICQYASYIDSIEPNKEKLLTVTYKKENDSTVCFDLSNIILFESKASIKKTLSFTFICKIKERDVLFFDNATELRSNKTGFYSFFKISPEIKEKIIDRNFIKDIQNNNENLGGMVTVMNYDPYHFHLTFANGRLVKKEIRLGSMFR